MASTGDTWRLGRRPALDGLRGIAVALVVMSHTDLSLIAAGPVGVTIFFVLSGFLITSLLLQEHSDTGRLNLAAFYARRARRLLPALFVFLAGMLAFGVATVPNVLVIVGYVSNWRVAAGASFPEPLVHTWSLAVEEQFYIAFPLLLVVLLAIRVSRVTMLAVLSLASIASMALRVMLWDPADGGARVYFATDTNAVCLLAGAALAVFVSGRPMWRSRPTVALLALAACIGLGLLGEGPFTRVVVPMLVAVLATAMLWCLCGEGNTRWPGAPALTYLGRRSYAVYLWHMPLLHVPMPLPEVARVGMAVGLSLLVAEVSWRFVERRFLKRRAAPVVSGPARLRARVQPVRLTRLALVTETVRHAPPK